MKKYQGNLIYSGKDEFGIVEVVDRSNSRFLHFGTAIEQSSMHLDDPFALEMEYNKTMVTALLFQTDPRRVLFLGLGGASKQKFLWRYFPECYLETVELSPLVIEVSRHYFFVPQDKRMEIICQNALTFLKIPADPLYDFIFIDLYISDTMSPAVSDPDFFTNCAARLKEGGLLIWNLWRNAPQDLIEKALQHMSAIFEMNFLVLPNSESPNYVLLIFKKPISPYSLDEIKYNAALLKEKTGLDFPYILEELHYFIPIADRQFTCYLE